MSTITTSAKYMLRILSLPGVGRSTANRILSKLSMTGSDLHAIDERQLEKAGVSQRVIAAWNGSGQKADTELCRLAGKGVWVVSSLDHEYPTRLRKTLGEEAPPLLCVMGNYELLQKDSVGYCGSRHASEKGLETAGDCARQVAESGVNVVSGYARGVDMVTHKTALECGGTTTIVLAEGIINFRVKREVMQVWDWSRVVVVSEFLPSRKWNAGQAMARNKTICALSNAMVLIEASRTGGSMAAGKEALRLQVPLFTPVYRDVPPSREGNRILLEEGAYQLRKSPQTGRANVAKIVDVVRNGKGVLEDHNKLAKSLELFSEWEPA